MADESLSREESAGIARRLSVILGLEDGSTERDGATKELINHVEQLREAGELPYEHDSMQQVFYDPAILGSVQVAGGEPLDTDDMAQMARYQNLAALVTNSSLTSDFRIGVISGLAATNGYEQLDLDPQKLGQLQRTVAEMLMQKGVTDVDAYFDSDRFKTAYNEVVGDREPLVSLDKFKADVKQAMEAIKVSGTNAEGAATPSRQPTETLPSISPR